MPGGAKFGLALAIGLLAALTAALSLYEISRARCFSLTGQAICRVATAAPMVALSFDDGPTSLGVEAILPELARHDAHATFFLIGAEAAKRPDLVRRLVAAGQEVGDHSFTHVRMIGHASRFY